MYVIRNLRLTPLHFSHYSEIDEIEKIWLVLAKFIPSISSNTHRFPGWQGRNATQHFSAVATFHRPCLEIIWYIAETTAKQSKNTEIIS